MGPTTNDLNREAAMTDDELDTDDEVYDTVVIVSSTPEEIEATRAQIGQTRAEMSGTIDAIKDRLNPEHLVQQAKDTVREATVGKVQDAASAAANTAKDSGAAVIEFIKENPIPLAVAGVGIAWLVANARRGTNGYRDSFASRPSYEYGPGYAGSEELRPGGAGAAMSQALGHIGDVAGQVQDKAGQIAGQVQDKAGQIAGQVQDQVSQFGAQAQYQSQRAVDWMQRLLDEKPLAAGAAALAVGMAIGLMVPETIQESRWMGAMRDNFMQKAQRTAHDVLEVKAQQVADAVSEKVHGMAQEAVDTIG